MRFLTLFAISLLPLFISLGVSSAQTPVVPMSFVAAKQPQIAVSKGAIFVAFGQSNTVYVTKSVDGGKTFLSAPLPLGTVDKLALGMRRGPRIFAGPNRITVTAISHAEGNLYGWSSADEGTTWGPPVIVNDAKTSAREGLHAMAGNGRGELFAVWLDLRNKGTQLWGSRSTDGGKTWQANIKVYESPEKSICECCHPSALFTSDGNLVVMWRNSLNGNRDLYQIISSDGGKSFAAATKLGSESWKLKGCPMDGGSLGEVSGKIINVWRRDTSIYTNAGDGIEQLVTEKGVQPVLVATPAGDLEFIWQNEGNL
ncbi:MAG: hypothetical protein JWM04_1491, partial [Verrucomicrobiales bacterium]|nr:hypothetical protein [Verrucomicrobiales bacterium]